VAESVDAVDGRIADDLFQAGELAGGAAEFDLPAGIDHGDAGGIIAAIFEAAETVNNERDDLLGSDVSDNAAHGGVSLPRLNIRLTKVRD
jgi:hypothetical protein